MRLIDGDALIEALMTYTWRDEDERLIDDADEKRAYIKQWLPVLPTVGGWISVEDRLPTYAEVKDDRVLVLTESGDIFSIGFDECIEGESIFGEWRQNFDPVTLGATDSDWISCDGVTHWMPLPEPPKEEDDED